MQPEESNGAQVSEVYASTNTWTHRYDSRDLYVDSEVWLQRSIYMDTKGGYEHFLINCGNQDSNSRPEALIPCHVFCTSQLSQKSELMGIASAIYIYCNTPSHM